MAGQANIDINVKTTTLGDLDNKLASLNDEIKDVGINSKEFKKLSREIQKTQAVADKTSKAVRGIDAGALAGDIAKVSGGLGAAGLAISSFTGENEALEETLKKTNAVLALSATGEAIYTATKKDGEIATIASNVATKASAIAQGAYTAVVGTSTGALKLFKLALAATGIGLILVGVGLLVANWDKLSKVISGSSGKIKEFAKNVLIFLGPFGQAILLVDKFAESIGGWGNLLTAGISVFKTFFTSFSEIADSVGTILSGIFTLDLDKIKAGIAAGAKIFKDGAKKAIEESEKEKAKQQLIEDLKATAVERERNIKRLEAAKASDAEIFAAKKQFLEDKLKLEELEAGKETDLYKDTQIELLALETTFGAERLKIREANNKKAIEDAKKLNAELDTLIDFDIDSEKEVVVENFIPGPKAIAEELERVITQIETELARLERSFLESGDKTLDGIKRNANERLNIELTASNAISAAIFKQIGLSEEGSIEKIKYEKLYQEALLESVKIQEEITETQTESTLTTSEFFEKLGQETQDFFEVVNAGLGLLSAIAANTKSDIDAIGVIYDNQTILIEENYARQAAAAGENANAIAAIEAEKNQRLAAVDAKRRAEEQKLRIKAAKQTFALDAGQIISSGALAIIKAIATLGPIAGPIAGILIGATTGIQLGIAEKAKNSAIAAAQSGGGGSVSSSSSSSGGSSNGGRSGFATGGLVQGAGSGTSDSINARLSDGEFVINAAATSQYLPLLEQINNGAKGLNNSSAGTNPELLALLKKLDIRLSRAPKAYVVSSEIQKGLDSDALLERRASLTN